MRQLWLDGNQIKIKEVYQLGLDQMIVTEGKPPKEKIWIKI